MHSSNAIVQSLQKHSKIILPEKINWFPGHMYKGLKELS